MSTDSGKTTSCWFDTLPHPPGPQDLPPLGADARADVCVIGAGVAGLSTAYHLMRAGRSVIVLDDGPIGGGESGRSAAHLVTALDERYCQLEKRLGGKAARLAAESHAAAIDRVEAIVRGEGLACGFARVDGYLFAPAGADPDVLDHELAATVRAGLDGVQWLPHVPVDFFKSGPCLRFPRQGQFHPLKYLAGLAQAIRAGGGRIHLGSHAAQIEDGAPVRVVTDGGHAVTAEAVVLATNSPIGDRHAVSLQQTPCRTYLIGVRVPRGSVPAALYWDTDSPYHYVRLADAIYDETQLLIVGGEDHRVGQGGDIEHIFNRLQVWTREHFPMAVETRFRWSGQVLEPSDGLPFIGTCPEGRRNVFLASGDSGDDMTHGTIAGMLLSDLIEGRRNPWQALYDPRRSAPTTTEGPAAPPAWLDDEQALAPGQGALVRQGGQQWAAYRDGEGRLHRCQARCTHLGCTLAWNPVERSWDCPCHGSRFDPHGRVVNGPANANLEPYLPTQGS